MNEKYAEYSGRPLKPERVWKAALYIRLSREDEDMSKAESNSITSQREFLKEFLKQHPDVVPFDFYVDDGWSGTNFDRPDFQRMMTDIYEHRVDCVIVKDLSRLGRNAAETSNYIDNVFARLQVRFIAIHNYIDTVESRMNAATHCITVGIQNVINESVAATTSVNVRGTLNVERQQGKFIGSFASYGYRKDPEDHHKLLIDPEAADVVRQIFAWFVGGKSIIGIAKELNEMGIPNPSAYKRLQGMKYRHPAGKLNDGLWPDSSVRRVLRNEVYIGNMIQGKNTTISFKHKQCRSVPQSEWYVVEGTHEAIIDEETFRKAQSLFNRNIRKSPQKNDVDLFSGFVRCADCHRAMNKKTNTHSYGTYHYYRCATARKMKKSACGNHTIRVDRLEEAVLVTIQKMVDVAVEMSEVVEKINHTPSRKTESTNIRSALKTALREKERLQNMQMDLYPDWKSGIITQEEYMMLKANLAEKLESIENNISSIQTTLEDFSHGIDDQNEFLATFKKYGRIEKLTRPMLIELVAEILVHEGNRVEVCFKYRDSYEEALEYIRLNGEQVTKPA